MPSNVKFYSKSSLLLFIFSIPFSLQTEPTLSDLVNGLCNQRINCVFHTTKVTTRWFYICPSSWLGDLWEWHVAPACLLRNTNGNDAERRKNYFPNLPLLHSLSPLNYKKNDRNQILNTNPLGRFRGSPRSLTSELCPILKEGNSYFT